MLTATYNTYTGSLETVSSEFLLRILKANVALARHITGQKISCSIRPGWSSAHIKSVNISSSIWYDAKGGGLRDMDITMRYQRQCWGLKFEMIKKPGDFTTLFMVELAGLNSEPSKDR